MFPLVDFVVHPSSAAYASFDFLYFVAHILLLTFFFFLMIRRPPRSTLDRSSAASDVYKRQVLQTYADFDPAAFRRHAVRFSSPVFPGETITVDTVSYTHLRAHETVLDLVCRLLLEKKKHNSTHIVNNLPP